VQIAPVAARAGVAAGTVYRYFPSKTDLVAALVAALSELELTTLERRRLAFALITEPVEPDVDQARAAYRRALVGAFERLIRKAVAGAHLPEQDAALAASALVGALVEGLIGPLAPAAGGDPGKARERVQMLTLFALRALGVVDARARGLVVQTVVPASS
jgi:AcrR family transcriptional regulator